MKLHLPKTLLTAVLAACAGFLATPQSANALSVSNDVIGTTFSTAEDFTSGSLSYDAGTGVLTGADSSAIYFQLNTNALIADNGNKHVIYVSNDATSPASWGFNTTTNGTGLIGYWYNNSANNGAYGTATVSNEVLTILAGEDGLATVRASITGTGGTYLYSTGNSQLYGDGGLRTSNGAIASITLDPTLVSNVYYGEVSTDPNGETTVVNADGSWSRTYNTANVAFDVFPDSEKEATIIRSGVLQISGNNANSSYDNPATGLVDNGGDIIIGNSGQLFLQTWQTNDITNGLDIDLSNADIYMGTSTQRHGALRLAAWSGDITLGNLTLIEDSSMWKEAAANGNVVNINGAVTGEYTLEIKLLDATTFNGNVDLKGIRTTGSTTASFGASSTVAVDTLTVGANTSLTAVEGADVDFKDINIQRAKLTLSGNVDVSGTIYTSARNNSGEAGELTITEGSYVTANLLRNSWGLELVVDGTLDIKDGGMQLTSGNADTFSGTGTLKTTMFGSGNHGTYTFEGGLRVEIGSGGIRQATNTNEAGDTIIFKDVTIAATESWTNAVTKGIKLADATTGTTFEVGEGKSITLSGVLSDTGKLVKTGEGTMTLRGANTYSGGTEVTGGTLIVNSGSKLGTGDVSITNATVEATHTSANGTSVIGGGRQVYINTGGTLKLAGHDMLGWGNNSPAAFNLASDDSTKKAILNIQDTSACTLKSNINLKGNSEVTGTQFNTFGTTLTATNTNNTISVSTILSREPLSIAVNGTDSTLTITSNIARHGEGTGGITKTGTGTLTLSGSSIALGEGINVNEGAVEFASTSNISLGSAINMNGGALNLGGATYTISDLSGFSYTMDEIDTTSLGTTQNGFCNTTQSYTIINGYSDTTVSGEASFKYNEQDITLNDGKYIMESSSSYYVVNIGKVATDSTDIEGALGFYVYSHDNQEAGTLVIKGDVGSLTPSDLMTSTIGNGNIELQTNATLAQTQKTQATGKLTVNGVTLTVGDSDLHNDSGVEGASISSFSAIELDGGSIQVNNPNDVFQNVTVTENNGAIHVYDMDEEYLALAGTTTLNGNLTITNIYNAQISVDKLAGTKDLIIDSVKLDGENNGTRSQELAVKISDKDTNYTGKVEIRNSADNLTLEVEEGLGLNIQAASTSGELNLTNIGAGNTVTLNSCTGSLAEGTINADIALGTGPAFKVTTTTGKTVTLAGDISGDTNFVVEPGSETNGGVDTYIFTGDVSGWNATNSTATNGFIAVAETNVRFEGEVSTINNAIIANNGGVLHAEIGGENAVTVNGLITNKAWSRDPKGTMNLNVSNTSDAGVTFKNTVTADKLSVQAGTKATFESSVTSGMLEMMGSVSFTAQEAMSVTDVTVGESAVISMGSTSAGVITASGAVSLAGGSTINGSLTLNEGATLEMTGLNGSNAITLSGTLTMADMSAMAAALDDYIATLSAGQQLHLFTGLEGLTVGGVEIEDGTILSLDSTSVVTMSDVTNATDGYYVNYVGGNLFLESNVVPEPTTATLSLLALAGLCARRRRRS